MGYVIPKEVMNKIQDFIEDYEKNENEFEGNDFKSLLKEAMLLINLITEESYEDEDEDEEDEDEDEDEDEEEYWEDDDFEEDEEDDDEDEEEDEDEW